MPLPVKCPVCRADGTAAANEILAQKLAGQSPASPAVKVPVIPKVPVVLKVPDAIDVPNAVNVPNAVKIPSVIVPGVAAVVNAADADGGGVRLRRKRAEQAQAALKAGLAPQLAQSLKEAVVQGLAAQRAELLKAQQCAALEISELVRRLDELKVPMQERLHSYEARIHELEKELAERNEENRELLKLKIEMIRSQLEIERTRSRVDFN